MSLEWANWYHRRRIANLPCDINGCPCRELNNGYVAHEQHIADLHAKRAAMPWWRRIFQGRIRALVAEHPTNKETTER